MPPDIPDYQKCCCGWGQRTHLCCPELLGHGILLFDPLQASKAGKHG
jgi:hypothetical protein